MSKKKIVKLAVIRSNEDSKCPFGLSIPFACENVGDLIYNMSPDDVLGENASSEDLQDIFDANKRLFRWSHPKKRCPFADKIIKVKGKVNCSWDSNSQGIRQEFPIKSAPFYSKVYNNTSFDGLFSYPIGFYADNNMSRNLYYGIFSLIGNDNRKDIEKFSRYIRNIEEKFNELNEYDKKILYDFADSYSNNEELNKIASNSSYDEITKIIRSWKDRK